jgi:hypothetical protein
MQKTVKQTLTVSDGRIEKHAAIRMVNEYAKAFPANIGNYLVGREVLELLLSQKHCAGLRLYHALGADGTETLVYVGMTERGKFLPTESVVGEGGEIKKLLPIVADRARPGTRPGIEVDELSWGLPG